MGLGLAGVLPGLAVAAPAIERRLVVVVNRGAWDGLAAVPAHGDPAFAAMRGGLDMGRAGVLDLDGFFGLHPAAGALQPLWGKGELLPVQAVGTTHRGRSHFEAQDVLEAGIPVVSSQAGGWLNRALAQMPASPGRRLGLAVGQAVPLTLRGPVPVAAWAPSRLPETSIALMTRINALWAQDPVLGPALAEGLKAKGMANEALGGTMEGGGRGGPAAFVALARAAGGLLATADGARLAVIDYGGWDTHAQQGTERGRMAQQMGGLAEGLVALADALGPAWRQTIVLCVSEFGRTVAPNGTGGTDHGTGGLALLAGGAVKGGRVLADWPGLAAPQLFEGRDLRPTIDLRGIYKAVLADHLGLDPETIERAVLPDSRSVRAVSGLVRS